MSSCDDTTRGQVQASDLAGLRDLQPESRRRGRNPSKATLAFYRIGDESVALKSFEDHAFPVRWLVGWWSIGREAANYEAMAGAPGLVPYLGRLGTYALATEWIHARPLAELDSVSPQVFDRLDEVVHELHRRGLALGDLHHGDVLVAEEGSVYLVDLAAAWLRGERPGWIRRRFFVLLQDIDRISAARMRARFTGEDPDAVVDRIGGSAARWHRSGRKLKAVWDRVRGKTAERREFRSNNRRSRNE